MARGWRARLASPTISLALLLAACGTGLPTVSSPPASAPTYLAKVLLDETPASALAVGPDGTIYFAVNQFDARGGAGSGAVRYLKPGSSAAQTLTGSTGAPIGAVAFDPRGNLYITRTSNTLAPANAVYRYEQDHFVLVAGGGTSLEPRGSATEVQLQGPIGLAFFADGQIAIAEYGDNRVLRLSPSGMIETFVGTGRCVAGLTPPADGRAEAIAICGPWSVAIDQASNLYVAPNERDWILRVDRLGNAHAISGFGRVTGIVAGRGDEIFVADVSGGRILRVEPRTTIADGLAAPRALAIDSGGRLIVATEQNRQVIELVAR